MTTDQPQKECSGTSGVENPLLVTPDMISPLIMLNNEASPAERAERSDAVANRRRILQTAEQLFAERGVNEVNMADIAKAAKVGQGTLYRRFANKSELCLALLDTQMTDFQNSVLLKLGEMARAHEPQLQQLAWFLDAMVYFHERHMPLICAAARDFPTVTMGRPAAWVWEQLTVRGLLQGALRTGEIRREIAIQLDLLVYADILLAPLQPGAFEMARNVDHYSLERISAGVRLLVWLLK